MSTATEAYRRMYFAGPETILLSKDPNGLGATIYSVEPAGHILRRDLPIRRWVAVVSAVPLRVENAR